MKENYRSLRNSAFNVCFGSGVNRCDCSWVAITATLTKEAQHDKQSERGRKRA